MTAKASDILAGPPGRPGLGGQVTSESSRGRVLSSRGLFQVLNWGAVRRHIAAAKPCRVADMGSVREIHVEALPGDVTVTGMAGGGGAAGPAGAPDIRHQAPGDASLEQCTITIDTTINQCKTLMH